MITEWKSGCNKKRRKKKLEEGSHNQCVTQVNYCINSQFWGSAPLCHMGISTWLTLHAKQHLRDNLYKWEADGAF